MKQIGIIFPDDLSTNNKVLSEIKKTDLKALERPAKHAKAPLQGANQCI